MITDEINASQLAYCKKLLETIFLKWQKIADILVKTQRDTDKNVVINGQSAFIYETNLTTSIHGIDCKVPMIIHYPTKYASPKIETDKLSNSLGITKMDDSGIYRLCCGGKEYYSDEIGKAAIDIIYRQNMDKIEAVNIVLDAFLPTLQQLKAEYENKTHALEESAKEWASI